MAGDGRPYRKGVGIALFNRRGEVLIAERIETPGAWQMPQGGLDAGEEPRAAALRELKEEVGTDRAEILAEHPEWLSYDLPAQVAAKMWGGKFRGQAQRWFALRFLGSDADIDISGAHGAHAEFAAWRWAPLASVPGLIVGFKQPIYRAVADAFAPVAARLAAER